MQSYTVIRSDRKTIAIQVKQDARIIVRAPKYMKREDIERFVKEKTPWIREQLRLLEEKRANAAQIRPFSSDELARMTANARLLIPSRVAHFASLMGVAYGRISIKHQHTRWGSCSGKKNLNFNCLLMLCPREVLDYVVVHELCHLFEMNHSKRFWTLVARYCPTYASSRLWLKQNGSRLISRLPKSKQHAD